MTTLSEVLDRLERNDRRLARLERHAGLGPMADEPVSIPLNSVPPPLPPMVEPRTAAGIDAARTASDLPAFPVAEPPARAVARPSPTGEASSKRAAVQAFLSGRPTSSAGTPVVAAVPTPERPDVMRRSGRTGSNGDAASALRLEQFIGAKFFAGVGGLIVTVGVGFFLKYGYEQGWFNMPPAAKCMAAAAFGAVLLLLGEVARRKINAWASAGLSSAGIATLLGSAYAAHAAYSLIGPSAAFGLMAASAALGFVVAWLTALPMVAGVALIGAYLTPILTRTDAPSPVVLPVYLGVLLTMALAMTWKLSERSIGFSAVRTLAWIGTVILGSVWCGAAGASNPLIAVVFLLYVPLAIHTELILTARRFDGTPDTETDEIENPVRFDSRRGARRPWANGTAAGMLVRSLATNAWSLAFATWIIRERWPEVDWVPAAAATAACGAMAAVLAGHLRALRDVPSTMSAALGTVLAGQTAGCFIATIAIALSGWTQSLTWLALGLGGVAAGRWARTRSVEVYGMVLMTLGTLRVLLQGAVGGTGGTVLLELGPAAITIQVVMTALSAAVWLAGARLLVLGADRVRSSGVIAAMAGVGMALIAAHMSLPSDQGRWLAPVWLAIALAAAVSAKAERRLLLDIIGMLVVLLSGLAWAVHWLEGYMISPFGPAAHPGCYIGLAIAAAVVLTGIWLLESVRNPELRRMAAVASWSVAGVMFFGITSMEVSRSAAMLAQDTSVRGSALSMYWAGFAAALVAIGFVRRLPPVRYFGLGLLGVTSIKVLVMDLAGVDPIWRVASTMGVGMLMIGVAMVYSKVSARLEREAPGGEPDGAG